MHDATKSIAAPMAGSSEKADPRGWYALLVMILSYVVYTLDKAVLGVLIEPIKREFSLSDSELSLLSGLATTVPFALACIPLGMLADRVRRTWLLAALLAGWSAVTGLAGLATSVTALVAVRVLVGALEAGFTPTAMSILGDSFPQRQRATATGAFSLGAPMGVFLALAAGGWVAAEHGWRAAFFLAGAPGVILAIIIALTVAEPRRARYDGAHTAVEKAPAPRIGAVLSNMWRNRMLFHITIGMTCAATLLAVLSTWTPSLLIRVYGLNLRQAGLAAALLVGVCGSLGAASGGFLADRVARGASWRRLWVPVLGSLCAVGCVATLLLVMPPIKWAYALLGGTAYFAQFFFGTGYAAALEGAPARMRGATVSVLLVLFNVVAYGLGTLIVGVVSDLARAHAGTNSIAWGIGTAAVVSLWGAGHFARALSLGRTSHVATH
jgi:MFS family permease